MAQLSISFGIDFRNLPVSKPISVKVAHRSSITAKVSDWNDDDLYEDIEDFDVTDQSWRSIVARY